MKREQVINARKQRGLSQEEISKLLGITRSAYSNYELGYRAIPLKIALEMQKILKSKSLEIFL